MTCQCAALSARRAAAEIHTPRVRIIAAMQRARDAYVTFCFSFELIKPKSHSSEALSCIFALGAENKVTLDQFHALFGADWDGSINGWINYIACSKGLKWYAAQQQLHCRRQSEKATAAVEKLELCQKSKA